MRCPRTLLVLLALFVLLNSGLCLDSQPEQLVVLHDPSRQALRSSAASVSPAAATATLCAASGLNPPSVIDKETAVDVEGVVQAQSALAEAPRAVVLLNLAGVPPGSSNLHKLEKAWGEGNTLQLQLKADTGISSAGSLLQSASEVVAANPEPLVTVLDHSALQNCRRGQCLQDHLHKAMHCCGGKLHAPASAQQHGTNAGLHGALELPGLDGQLDMALPGVKLFALELAALSGSVQQQLAQLKQQSADDMHEVLHVFESTFVGLQALAAHFPKGSDEFQAAKAALMDVVSHTLEELRGIYGDTLLYQVAFLGDAPVPSGDAADLMEWKEVSRRVLLERSGQRQSPGLGADEASSSKRYAEKATAYGVTLLLIWFTFAGVYCMVSMRFKQDTLLYGRSKTD